MNTPLDDISKLYAPPEANLLPQADSLAPILANAVYPLNLRFKFWALAQQVYVNDATGRTLLYVKQKLFRFREHVDVFASPAQTDKVAEIKANKIIDWTLRYHFRDAQGAPIGEVGRKGFRSLWRATYDVFNPGDDQPDFHIREENPGAKFLDSAVGQIPIVGAFTGYFLHPRYAAKDAQGNLAMRVRKLSAFLEGKFEVEKHQDLPVRQQMNLILSFLMMILLERRRG